MFLNCRTYDVCTAHPQGILRHPRMYTRTSNPPLGYRHSYVVPKSSLCKHCTDIPLPCCTLEEKRSRRVCSADESTKTTRRNLTLFSNFIAQNKLRYTYTLEVVLIYHVNLIENYIGNNSSTMSIVSTILPL